MDIKLSIIIPVYNGERSIEHCLKSILQQQISGIELIVINDGSTDLSEFKIQEMIKQHKDKSVEIYYYYQENSGVAVSRNFGVSIAKGEFITFVDQDDYLDQDYCKNMLQQIVNTDYDILVAGYKQVDESGNVLYIHSLDNNNWIPYTVITPWAHIYCKKFLLDNDIKFLSTGMGEDIYFNLIAYLSTKKIKILNYSGYNWVMNPQSVSHTNHVKISENNNPFILLDALENEFEQRKIEMTEYREYFIIKYIVWYILYTLSGSAWADVKKMKEKLYTWLYLKYPNYKKNPNISFKLPKGDSMRNRWSVWILIRMHSLKLDNVMLRLLKLLM